VGNQLLGRGLRWGKWVLATALVGFLGWTIYLRWSDVAKSDLRFEWIPFALGLVCLFIFYGLYSLSWRTTLIAIEPASATLNSLSLHRVFFVAFISRYLPGGKALNLGSRVELLKRLGGRRALGLESLFYEQLYMVLGAVALGIMAIVLRPYPLLPIRGLSAEGLGVVGIAIVIGVGLVVADLPLAAPPDWFRLSFVSQRWKHVSIADKARLMLRFLVVNLAQGLAVFLVLRSIYPPTNERFVLVVIVSAAYAIGRVVGQLAAVVPGGLGVREGAYASLLGPFLPIQPVLLSAALFRLVSIVVEVLITVVLIGVERARTTGSSERNLEPGKPAQAMAPIDPETEKDESVNG
jgi:uncharacterized membrane protein YbhN (UPF0104 family)